MALSERVKGLAHIGIRVHDLARSRAFYERLGFTFVWGPFGPEQVCGLTHPSGLEVNFIVNAPTGDAPNVLMDIADKHPGFTHVALKIDDVTATRADLQAAGIAVSGTRGEVALFVRDPDGNVVELASD
ncbi:MAG TPA: VOC family protein [Caulobacteraceae bacterium]|jgi:lactoylglutathione lyase|nr:VOC family protein [Caulobacteraceae bacterium]